MRPLSGGGRLDGRGDDDRAVATYVSLCHAGEPSLERYWAGLGPGRSLATLGALVKVDLQARFDRGQRPTVTEYLGRFPALVASGERVISLIYEEFCLLEEMGEEPDSARFCEVYGPWGDSLRSQLAYHRELSRVIGAESPPTRFPKPGEKFACYQLKSILGVGGAARVYLATDDGLGGRKVALKLSASVGREPSILANLDHRNIVPILTVAESDSGLRGFCMPYRPGLTLEELIRRIGREAVPRKAHAIWDALKPTDEAEVEVPQDDRVGWSGFPTQGSFPEAVAWIGLALAHALTYLHGRGVLHRDIKPANVLLAFREGPQLLDFNLAHSPNAPENAQAALKGGTLPYMAPEQLRAFLNPAAWDDVGSPADLYALGLVLRGLLTGRPPELPNPELQLPRAILALHDRRSLAQVPIRRDNPGVPPSLESIIDRCLEFDPGARYGGAADLAEDLRRFLDRRPLKFAINPSLPERATNFGYRNRLLGVGAAILVGAFLMGSPLGPLERKARPLPDQLQPPRPTPIPDLPEFRQAVRDLGLGSLDAWRRASEAFLRIDREHPRSAWPCLYLGLTLDKIGTRTGSGASLEAANQKLAEAAGYPDYDRALERRVREDPRSATLRTLEAIRILDNKADPERYRKAYPVAQVAVKADPGRPRPLALIADIERNLDRLEEAIAHMGRAIEIAEGSPPLSASMVNSWRSIYLPLLSRRADLLLDRGTTEAERRQADEYFRRMEAQSSALDRHWEEGPPAPHPVMRAYFRHLYDGSAASGLATLEARGGHADAARDLFGKARVHLEAARRLAAENPSIATSSRMGVEQKFKELEARARKSDRPAADPSPRPTRAAEPEPGPGRPPLDPADSPAKLGRRDSGSGA